MERADVIHRRGREDKFVFADRKCHRPGAVVQRHLLLGALPLTEREDPLPPSDRHPAKRLPRRIPARGFLLCVDDGCHRGAKLEIASRTRCFRQLLELTLDEAGVDGIRAHLWMRDQR